METGKLDLNPEYQRGSVWVKSQQQLLIDSLMRDIDIPKFYFRRIDRDGFTHEVVDGQQRLRAIFGFLNDTFAFANDADKVEGFDVRGLLWSSLDSDLQDKFFSVNLDVVTFSHGYSDDAIEEMFLRLQSGTPLNAPEKRRAIAGNMRKVVEEVAQHKVFPNRCGFKDVRFAYEDVVAKTLHMMLAGHITDIRAASITKTYESHKSIEVSQKQPQRLVGAYNFIEKAFKSVGQSPKFKKYAIISVGYLVADLLDHYNLSKYPNEFAAAYLDFETARIQNEELVEELQDAALAAYTNAARADSIPDIEYRHRTLRSVIMTAIPELEPKDSRRDFSSEQRLAIFRRDGGQCQMCSGELDEASFHADHIKPFSQGGKTTVANGQALCAPCNLRKGDG
jgi:hypothetical protein